MASKIYKYPLLTSFNGLIRIELPRHARILTAQLQNGVPVLWVEVDPKELDTLGVYFQFVPTGDEVPVGTRYVSTIQFPDGLVFHLYVETNTHFLDGE